MPQSGREVMEEKKMEELPKPLSKQDKFLHNIADGSPDIDDIEAISRQDKYLKYIALNGGTSGGNINQKLGTWTPTLVNYTDSAHPNTVVDPTYSVIYSNAHYLKTGKLVHISFRIKVEITDIGTGFACVAGLPFNPDQDMVGQSFCISENSAVTESDGVVYDGVVGQLYPDIYLETYNERHIPAISLRTDNGIQAKTFKVGTNWISYSGCYVCDDPYVPPQDSLVTIEHGGTSGKTALEARTNLDIYSKSEVDSKISPVEIVQQTGTSTTKVMSQNAVSTMSAIGDNASATGSASLAIGKNSEAKSTGSIAIGYKSKAQTNDNIAIGRLANASATDYARNISIGALSSSTASNGLAIGTSSNVSGENGVSIGEMASTTSAYSVALGSGSIASQDYTISVGSGLEGSTYKTRRIVNVSDPINEQDTATKNYVDNHLAGLSIPSIPSTGTYTLQASDGVLSWVQIS